MKTFEQLLLENKIKTPRYLGKKAFKRKYSEVNSSYDTYSRLWKERNCNWEELRTRLKEDWGEVIPSLEELEPFPEFRFSNLCQANFWFDLEIEKIQTNSLTSLYIKLDKEFRANWITEILHKAPDEKLIVIKNLSYSPCKEDIMQFNKSVGKKLPACISLVFTPMWVAFYPQEASNIDLQRFRKNSSTVEFL